MSDRGRSAALIHHRLTPVYDLFVRLFLRDKTLKHNVAAQMHIDPGHRVLDLGAGTGTLALLLKRAQPAGRIYGLDRDPEILTIARAKAVQAGVNIDLGVGDAVALPFRDESFDRVVSSLVFSLLSHDDKQRAAREAYRVLQRGGELVFADFGPPRTTWGKLFARRMRRFEPIIDNLDGRLPRMFRRAGFADVEEVTHLETVLGTITILSGRK